MWKDRTINLIGIKNSKILERAHIAVFGLGGVGSFAFEALVRAGVGEFTIIDHDIVTESNINRQLVAQIDSVGRLKTDIAKDRALLINEEVSVTKVSELYTKERREHFFNGDYDYVIDAIDDINAKIDLIETCFDKNIKIISAMGTANKVHPECFEVTTLAKTSVCPVARILRHKLNEQVKKSLRVVYSKEEPIKPVCAKELGSISFVPSVCGLIMAGEAMRDIIDM